MLGLVAQGVNHPTSDLANHHDDARELRRYFFTVVYFAFQFPLEPSLQPFQMQ
jgi:hypothetical protein